jgi:hypothetical protein
MAIATLVNPAVWVGPYRISGDLAGAALKYGREQKEATTFGMVGKARKAGLFDTSLDYHGYWNGGGPSDLAFAQLAAPSAPVTIAPANAYGADGEMAYSFPALHSSYEVGAAIGELLPFTVKADASGDRLVRGTLMHSTQDASNVDVLRVVSGTGEVRQLGATSATQKLYIGVHVIAATGSLTVILKSAALVGFGSPTTRYTSSAFTAIGSDWATVVGPITDEFYRVDWTISGGGPSFGFAVVVGII